MACMKLGSKSDVFLLDRHTWWCSTGLPSDATVEVNETVFHLHKFPLLSRSGVLVNFTGDISGGDQKKCVMQLHDIPGGAKTFLLVAKFCYGVKIELTALNVVALRCAAEYLQMTEDFGEGNLIVQTEKFLNEIFSNWADSIKALETCGEVLPQAEELYIVSRCIKSLAQKACVHISFLSWPMSGDIAAWVPESSALWNGIRSTTKSALLNEDWWYEDVTFLTLPLYKYLIMEFDSRGMKKEMIAASLMLYTKKHLPLLGRKSNFNNGSHIAPKTNISDISDRDKNLLEEIVRLMPDLKGVTPTKFLLRLLRTSMILHASSECRDILEKKIGAQLDQASLEDLLIPNTGSSEETLYDIDCVQRILNYFMVRNHDITDQTSIYLSNEGQFTDNSHSLSPMTMVAYLMDGYLAEVAPDENLKLAKFEALAAVIPDYIRPLDDGIYRAIDIYLKAHPYLTEPEREDLCRVMNCQKLSLEASTHAAQNERLPLRVIVQVLFFEQLQLRTSLAGFYFVSDNLDSSQDLGGKISLARHIVQADTKEDNPIAQDDMSKRLSELEKECLSMKRDLKKLVKKETTNTFLKIFSFKLKHKSCDPKTSTPSVHQ